MSKLLKNFVNLDPHELSLTSFNEIENGSFTSPNSIVYDFSPEKDIYYLELTAKLFCIASKKKLKQGLLSCLDGFQYKHDDNGEELRHNIAGCLWLVGDHLELTWCITISDLWINEREKEYKIYCESIFNDGYGMKHIPPTEIFKDNGSNESKLGCLRSQRQKCSRLTLTCMLCFLYDFNLGCDGMKTVSKKDFDLVYANFVECSEYYKNYSKNVSIYF